MPEDKNYHLLKELLLGAIEEAALEEEDPEEALKIAAPLREKQYKKKKRILSSFVNFLKLIRIKWQPSENVKARKERAIRFRYVSKVAKWRLPASSH